MFPYAVETFSADEEDVLRHYVTNLDRPVYALVNLPEVVKGALFARYSRSHKSLRRLFLDEFVGELDISGDASVDATVGLKRAEELYEKVFFEYGVDSVAQLGGVHLACEQASNVLTKVLEWGRLMAYLEQSTRYIAYDQRLSTGHYRYYRDPGLLDSPLGARYVGDMDRMFDSYSELLEQADRDLAADLGIYGIVTGAIPTQHSPVPALNVDLTSPTRAYDHLGQRIFIGTDQTVDCTVDLVGIPTTVTSVGNERWLGVFLRFTRQLSDPRAWDWWCGEVLQTFEDDLSTSELLYHGWMIP